MNFTHPCLLGIAPANTALGLANPERESISIPGHECSCHQIRSLLHSCKTRPTANKNPAATPKAIHSHYIIVLSTLLYCLTLRKAAPQQQPRRGGAHA